MKSPSKVLAALILATAVLLLGALRAEAYVGCSGPGCPNCSSKYCMNGGSCTMCLMCDCTCICESIVKRPRPRPNDPGLSLSSTNSWNNEDATGLDVLNAFITAYNWDVTVNGVDPLDIIIGDTDFTGISGTQLLDSLASTMDSCYTVDSDAYEITFDACP